MTVLWVSEKYVPFISGSVVVVYIWMKVWIEVILKKVS